MTPLSLNGSSVHVRRLVVHLPPTFLTAHEDLHGCNESVRRMELLKLSFPRLEICICVIPIASFWSVLRKLSQTKADAAKKELAQVIAAFLEFGSGRRKLVRCNATGPLMEFGHHEASSGANLKLDTGEMGDEECVFALSAGRIVEHSDTFHRPFGDTGR
jgi:hypothetical protein